MLMHPYTLTLLSQACQKLTAAGSPACTGYHSHCLQGEPGAVASNEYSTENSGKKSAYRLAKAMLMERRGGRCFDFSFYRARSKDLPPLSEPDLWQHFVRYGQFEGRPFR